MTAAIRYRNEIDGLRAIAVGAVILDHFDPAILPSGYLGVDIFFVISGYVITLSLCGREFGSLRDFLLGFYARRFKRLVPALILCVGVTAGLTSLFDSEPAESLKTGFFALFGLSNLYLLRIANDYFGGPSQLNSFTHTWSLGVEEQFYLLFPLILWLFLRQQGSPRIRIFCVAIVAAAALSLALFAVIGTRQPMASFYLMPLRFWELAAGCLIAMIHDQRERPDGTRRQWLENGIVILILVTLMFPPQLALFANIAVVTGTAAALAALSQGSLANRVLTGKVAAYLGKRSYSLYLWHWPVLVISRYTGGLDGWSVPIAVSLIFAIAHVSYRYVESPLRARPWAASNGRTILWGGAATCAAAGFVAVLAVPLAGRLYVGKPAQLVARNVESLSYPYRIAGTSYAWAGARCILSTNADAGKAMPLDACTLGRFNQAKRRVMVFGNSFSAAFVHGFDALVTEDDYAVTVTSSWGASPIGGVPNTTAWSRSNAYYWGTVVPQMASRLRPGDWVVLMSDLSDLAPRQPTAGSIKGLKLYEQGLRQLATKLAKTRVRLAVLDVNPFIRDSGCRPETALPQWFAPSGGPCTFFTKAHTLARRRQVDAMLLRLQQERQLVVIDTIDVFCPSQTCTFLGNNGQVLYRDEFSHPSVEAARAAAPSIRRVLGKNSAGI